MNQRKCFKIQNNAENACIKQDVTTLPQEMTVFKNRGELIKK